MEEVVFGQWRLGQLPLRNRLVRSATNMRMAGPKGEVTDALLEVHRRLAEGGIGLDITGHAFVSPEGKVNEGQIGVYDDSLIEGLSRLAEVVHGSGAKVLLQLAHGGALARAAEGPRIAPSPSLGAREVAEGEVEEVVEKFVQAARRAYEAGFDGVQLHAAHGYLLSAFLSPRMNRREDRYGGREGGVRVLKEIIEGIKALAGDGFLVAVKLGVDGGKRGNGPQEVVEVLRGLAASGLHCAEISRGVAPVEEIIREGVKPGEGEAYNLEVALYVKEHLPSLPLILVGGLRSFEVVLDVIQRGIEAVAFCRPLIAEPELPKRWAEGDRSPARCLSCNRCFTVKEVVACRRDLP
ncbi:MAG: NADH:flavin oxidoreductase [Deltaproteobacteria bacterium]|nr:MAG: NADH:flavin oxidoreductase [Deltaproteobacteria bacterium]RLB00215.1 MAG: NADH:flavin oxidoreductase [Deltaproteobacteria bacterium]